MAMLDESLESYISSERPECTLEKSEVLNPNEKREAFTVVDASYYEGRHFLFSIMISCTKDMNKASQSLISLSLSGLRLKMHQKTRRV